ncbi:MAG: HupE/UreJ family protein [gamma proteobacterium endosymbiont of Lamellibrachia anaximandri]|nr:HupE/UreJ family protein [gamma proteobacterium endosymbiont of Lamellibrachia anaximandri]MBL3619352.1 HupE/UreJ family protein [gamma proteobacterium endosymbiont of Lamellibrachia anaximandri]
MAHIGAAGTDVFLSGILHSISGIDHLVTMFGLGLWISFLKKTQAWRMSVASIAMLLLGMSLGLSGFAVPLMETLNTLSLPVLGLMIVLKMRLPILSDMAIVGLFAVLHGYAHGLEMLVTSPAIPYAVGLVSAGFLLQLTGYTIGSLFIRRAWAIEVSGQVPS